MVCGRRYAIFSLYVFLLALAAIPPSPEAAEWFRGRLSWSLLSRRLSPLSAEIPLIGLSRLSRTGSVGYKASLALSKDSRYSGCERYENSDYEIAEAMPTLSRKKERFVDLRLPLD